MSLPYKIATLLYGFNPAGEVLLIERAREPNRGLWSPAGGKLKMEIGESPYVCACREAREELGLALHPRDLHLAGLVSEDGYEGREHWLMFLFEIAPPILSLPPAHEEGRFQFIPLSELSGLALPQTDREQIWPLFLKNRHGFFAAHCHCLPSGKYQWSVEEIRSTSQPLPIESSSLE